jgi:hypothetical protein
MHRKVCNDLRDASFSGRQGGGRKLRVWEAADYVKISVSRLNKLRVYGGGPAYFKVGHSVIYDTAELDAWLTVHRRISTSESKENAR